MDEPSFARVKARDLVPYRHAVWSSIRNGPPFANTVMIVQWTSDGRISVMLDSHNFLHEEPDAYVDCVIERADADLSPFCRERVAAWKGPRPHNAGPFDD